ncbi:hypothetical protein BIW11_03987 [Tropilaelaps mercedesae]|uniref:Uncharacterized protein n=1 Tax=Tropilaelaps mercedesae TaxID=418985 RepID=A0A1V9XDC0_9ACAR|nr:hypothetical protein BIW11_03987 [Tropilaelaps mercedesae]
MGFSFYLHTHAVNYKPIISWLKVERADDVAAEDHPFNVTWSCVSSLERGCFEEKAGKDLFKEVCLCDNVDRCNRVPGQHSTISSSRALLVLALLAYRLLNYLVL